MAFLDLMNLNINAYKQEADLWLRQGVAGAPSVEALPNTILLSAVGPNDSLHFVQRGIATVRAEQAARLLQIMIISYRSASQCRETY